MSTYDSTLIDVFDYHLLFDAFLSSGVGNTSDIVLKTFHQKLPSNIVQKNISNASKRMTDERKSTRLSQAYINDIKKYKIILNPKDATYNMQIIKKIIEDSRPINILISKCDPDIFTGKDVKKTWFNTEIYDVHTTKLDTMTSKYIPIVEKKTRINFNKFKFVDKIDEIELVKEYFEQANDIGVLLCGGYSHGSGGHLITIFVQKESTSNFYKMVLTNSGEGYDYHSGIKGELRKCILCYNGLTKTTALLLLIHTIAFRIKYSSIEKNIKAYYQTLDEILDSNKKNYNLFTTSIDNENKDNDKTAFFFRKFEYNKNYATTIISNYDDSAKEFKGEEKYLYLFPQKSGSCTFYGIYYWIYYKCLAYDMLGLFYVVDTMLKLNSLKDIADTLVKEIALDVSNEKNILALIHLYNDIQGFDQIGLLAEKKRIEQALVDRFIDGKITVQKSIDYKAQHSSMIEFNSSNSADDVIAFNTALNDSKANSINNVYEAMLALIDSNPSINKEITVNYAIIKMALYLKEIRAQILSKNSTTILPYIKQLLDDKKSTDDENIYNLMNILFAIENDCTKMYTEKMHNMPDDTYAIYGYTVHILLIVHSIMYNILRLTKKIKPKTNDSKYANFVKHRALLFKSEIPILSQSEIETIKQNDIKTMADMLPIYKNDNFRYEMKDFYTSNSKNWMTDFFNITHLTGFTSTTVRKFNRIIIGTYDMYNYTLNLINDNTMTSTPHNEIINQMFINEQFRECTIFLKHILTISMILLCTYVDQNNRWTERTNTCNLYSTELVQDASDAAYNCNQMKNVFNYMKHESYVLLIDILSNKKYDIINNFTSRWDDNIITCSTNNYEGTYATNNNVIVDAKEGMNSYLITEYEEYMKNMTNKIPIDDQIFVRTIRNDMFIWIIYMLIRFNETLTNHHIIKQELKKRYDDNKNSNKLYEKMIFIILYAYVYGDTTVFNTLGNDYHNVETQISWDVRDKMTLRIVIYMFLMKYDNLTFDWSSTYYLEKIREIFGETKYEIAEYKDKKRNKHIQYVVSDKKGTSPNIYVYKENAAEQYVPYSFTTTIFFSDKTFYSYSDLMYDKIIVCDTNMENILYVINNRSISKMIDKKEYKYNEWNTANNLKLPTKYIIRRLCSGNTSNIMSNKNIIVYNGTDIEYIEIPHANVMISVTDSEVKYKDYTIMTENIPYRYEQFVYGINNAFIMKKDNIQSGITDTTYYILLLRWGTNPDKIVDNNVWDHEADIKYIFEGNSHILQLQHLGLGPIYTNDPDYENALQAYLTSCVIFCNFVALDLIMDQCIMRTCVLPFQNKLNTEIKKYIHYKKPYTKYVANNPYKYYYKTYFVENNFQQHSEKKNYDERKIYYLPKYQDTTIKFDDFNKLSPSSFPETMIMKNFAGVIQTNMTYNISFCNRDIKDIFDEVNLMLGQYNTSSITLSFGSNKISLTILLKNVADLLFLIHTYDQTSNIIHFIKANSHRFYNLIYMRLLSNFMRNKDEYKEGDSKSKCNEIIELLNSITADNPNGLYEGTRTLGEMVFELMFCGIMKQKQKDIIDDLITDLEDIKKPKKIFQFLMGQGKTSVITPLIAAYNINNNRQCIAVMPTTLVPQSYGIFCNLSYLFRGIRVGVFKDIKDTSKADHKDEKEYELNFRRQRRQILIVNETYVKHRLLLELAHENPDITLYNRNKYNNTAMLFDEIDTLLDPLSSELNMPPKKEKKETPSYMVHLGNLATKILINNMQIPEFKTSDECKRYVNNLLKNTTINTPEWNLFINNLDTTSIERDGKKRERYASYVVFKNTLMQCLQMVYNKHYGFGSRMQEKEHNDKIAIPYISVRKPADGSEFSDPIITLILTVLCYKYNGISKSHLLDLYTSYYKNLFRIDTVKKHYEKIFLNNNATNIWMKMKDEKIYSIRDISSTEIQNIQNNHTIISDYLTSKVIKEYIQSSKRQYNTSMYDIITSDTCTYRAGFSGTTNILLPKFIGKDTPIDKTNRLSADYIEPLEPCFGKEENKTPLITYRRTNEFISIKRDDVAEDEVAFATKYHFEGNDIKTNRIYSLENRNAPKDMKEDDIYKQYDALIDVAAFFRTLENVEVAEKLSKLFGKTRPIVYWGTDDKDKMIPADEKEVNPKKFLYYDQSHIIGIDYKQPPVMKGLVVVSKNNRMKDFAQGMYRLRKLNKGHSVDFLVIDDPTITTCDELYKRMVDNENAYGKSIIYRAKIQIIKVNKRNSFEINNPADMKQKLIEHTDIVYDEITNTKTLPLDSKTQYKKFVQSNICTDRVMQNITQNYLCQKLCNYLSKVSEFNTGQEMNTQKETETQKQKEAIVDKNKPVHPTLITVQWNKDITAAMYDNPIEFASVDYKERDHKNFIDMLNVVYKFYVSPLWIKRVVETSNGGKVLSTQLNLVDGIVVNDNLLITCQEYAVLHDKFNKATRFGANNILAKFLTFNCVEYDDMFKLFEKFKNNHDDLRHLVQYLISIFGCEIPSRSLIEHFLRTPSGDGWKSTFTANLQTMMDIFDYASFPKNKVLESILKPIYRAIKS